ncbi:MAG TPA: HIG1 domain-containing protein [Terriglobia bacterium]|nr:HIG1 domain-containing protein [Terriglobia bacterium]
MEGIFLILTGLFAVATLAIVLTGILGMAQGGAFNKRYGNKLMRLRVLFQGLTIASVFLYVLIRWMER